MGRMALLLVGRAVLGIGSFLFQASLVYADSPENISPETGQRIMQEQAETPVLLAQNPRTPVRGTRSDQKARPELRRNSLGMVFVRIPAGKFQMGSPPGESSRRMEEPQHEVTISQDYFLGIGVVTQGQYEPLMGRSPGMPTADPSGRFLAPNRPAGSVSWDNAVRFCQRLAELPAEKNFGNTYRLPTEAEWEYACRAGTTTAYSFGDDPRLLPKYASFTLTGSQQTIPFGGQKLPNAWGLYDMHGPMREWCHDFYGSYSADPVTDPLGPETGSQHVQRGGDNGYMAPETVRSASRRSGSGLNVYTGFRVVLVPKNIDPPVQRRRSAQP